MIGSKNIQTMAIVLLSFLVFSCKKKDNKEKDETQIDTTNLTTCASGHSCQYLFTENADIEEYNRMKAGSYRVFWASQKTEISENIFYFRTPMKGDSFELGKAEIARGDVKYLNICATCNTIGLKAVDGFVKGINLTPGKQADQTRWLLEIQIFLQMEGGDGSVQVVSLKQIYYPNFVYN
jgi:hypothetical protein